MIDYPKTLSAIVFTLGCNFRCHYCHNPEIVDPKLYSKDIIDTEDEILDLVILSLYFSGNPPRRIIDYSEMYISNDENIYDDITSILWINKNNDVIYDNDKVVKINLNKELVDKNFFKIHDKDTSFFIFNNYKTNNIYSKQIIEVNNDLNSILKKYIDICKLKNKDKLFNISRSNFVSRINNIFQKIINKSISVSNFRHSFITYLLSNSQISIEYKKKISFMMAHSISMQDKYRKIVLNDNNYDNDEIICNINAYKNRNLIKKTDLTEKQKKIKENKLKWYHANKTKINKK